MTFMTNVCKVLLQQIEKFYCLSGFIVDKNILRCHHNLRLIINIGQHRSAKICYRLQRM